MEELRDLEKSSPWNSRRARNREIYLRLRQSSNLLTAAIIMFARRAGLLRTQRPFRLNACRAFSTTELDSGVKIAYDFFEPAKEATSKDAPIVFIHGLFGSKMNNGSMSKYAACAL